MPKFFDGFTFLHFLLSPCTFSFLCSFYHVLPHCFHGRKQAPMDFTIKNYPKACSFKFNIMITEPKIIPHIREIIGSKPKYATLS